MKMKVYVVPITLGAMRHHKLRVAIGYDIYRGQHYRYADRWEDSCPSIAPEIKLREIRIECAGEKNSFYNCHQPWTSVLEILVFNYVQRELEDCDSPLYTGVLQYEEADGSLYV